MFLETIAPAAAQDRIAEIYGMEKAALGFVTAATRSWTARPDLLPLFQDFFEGVQRNFSLSTRDWCLITLAAAKRVPSTYCSYAYGRRLIKHLGSKEAVLAVHADHRNAGLSPRDVAMLDYAVKVVTAASSIGEPDIAGLREAGFSDTQICDIALCASLRCFMSRFFDALGATPEPAFFDADDRFRAALTVGRVPATSPA